MSQYFRNLYKTKIIKNKTAATKILKKLNYVLDILTSWRLNWASETALFTQSSNHKDLYLVNVY